MRPVISEEEGWGPLTGGRTCACGLSEAWQKPGWAESKATSFGGKHGCERAAFAHGLLNYGFTFCRVGNHLQS